MNFYTVGVYNSSEEEFFNKLQHNKIDTFCDIRQRRGVRGAKYSFVNSQRLQGKLKDLGIKYFHFLDLAPTKEIRELQKLADLNNQELKRNRTSLGEVFINEYNKRIIETFSFEDLLDELKKNKVNNIVLFCVEESHKACHRSLVANELSNKFSFKIKNI